MPTPRKTKSKKTKTSTGTSKKTKTAGRKTTSRTASASAAGKTAKKTKTSSKAAGSKKTKTKAKSAKKTKTKVVKKTTSTKTAAKPKAAAPKASKPRKTPPKAAPVEAEPDRSHLDAEFLATMRLALVTQRERLLSVVKSTRAQMAEKNNALPDVSDQAAEGYGDELAVGLIAIEAAQLDDIEAAIERIDKGTYGICEDTGKPIPKKRLEVLPFVRRCLEAEQAREHRARTQSGYVEEEDD